MAKSGTAPNEWQCMQFIAVVENQGTVEAAAELSRMYPDRCKDGKPVNRQSVDKSIQAVEAWAGVPLLERGAGRKLYPTAEGQEFLEAARSIVAEYRIMRGESSDQGMPTLACLPHHTHFVAIAEAILSEQAPVGREKIEVVYLDQRHRGDNAFLRHAVARLRQNVYQLIIGPSVQDQMFESIPLYVAQLEAMVPAAYAGNAMSLTELLREHRMMVAPKDMRSRKLLEDQAERWRIPDPHRHTRVAAETYETGTSIMRIRIETHRANQGSRVVVAPSDVALAYKAGREFGGLYADRFKWVPLVHTDNNGHPHRLTLDVCVTRKRGKNHGPAITRAVEALKTAVAKLDESGEVGLCGEGLIPEQRARQMRSSF